MQQQLTLNFTTASPINIEKFTRQNKIIYEYLSKGNTITVFKAIGMGIFHLHSRCADLRKEGVMLYDRWVNPNGEKCKEYSLTPFPP